MKGWDPMPYDTVMYGEAGAMSGYTGIAALGGQNHKASGDIITLLSGIPYLNGFGLLSDTKPRACALIPSLSNNQNKIYGPAGIDYWADGWAQWMRSLPMPLQDGETLTGNGDNTNVSEGTVMGMDLTYNEIIAPWELAVLAGRYAHLYSQEFTVTSATAVVYNSGPVDLDSATTETDWLNKEESYEIIGIAKGRSGATFGGILNITKLSGAWQGKQPGIVANPLSAVTFNAGAQFAKALEPIPFKGDAVPQVGMTATSAGAYIGDLVIGMLA